MRAAAALFPAARATVLTIHEPAIGPATAFRVGGGLMSPGLVERSLTEFERGAVARTAIGSTSSSLLHHAETAVLVVPEAGAPRDGPALIA